MSDDSTLVNVRRRTRPMDLADLDLAKAKTSVRLNVFVAGPYISKDWSEEEIAAQGAATRLRLKVRSHIENFLRHEVVLGEHRGIVEMGEVNIRSRATIVLSEVHVLKTHCHAVIMLPSSPGSFCELGTWSPDTKIAGKMLILGDKQFEHEAGYVQLGVFKLAQDRGAELIWVDYEDSQSAEAAVTQFLDGIQDSEVAFGILAG